MLAANADLTKIRFADSVKDYTADGDELDLYFSLQRDVALLADEIRAMGDCKLVIIDPVTSYLSGTDTHKNADVRALLAPLSK